MKAVIILVIAAIVFVIAVMWSGVPTAYLRIRNKFRHKGRAGDRELCLTFDDGPSAEYTPRLLDLLKRYDVKATFFVVAKFAEENPDIIERMLDEGHCIGLHSYDHKFQMTMGLGKTKRDYDSADQVMRKLGLRPKYYRAPWGTVNVASLDSVRDRAYKLVFWDVMVGDWSAKTTVTQIIERLQKKTRSGDIICLHDGRGSDGAPGRTIEALGTMIPYWKKHGYRFVAIPEK